MAAVGYTPISLYYSTTGSAVPVNTNLVNGELAINITDGKLYYKDNGGTVQLLASKAGASGDVVGPASATDNAVARFDLTSGKLIQNSAVTIADTTGDITGGAYNKVTITAPATSATLTIADGKTLTANNSITFAGTDSTTMTFPSTSTTIAGLGIAQTFTATNTYTQINYTNNAITATANAATVPITHRLNTVTNNSAATLTITMTTTSAVDGQMSVVRILDASAVAQTISWVNTENSTVSVPTTSNGSTTLPLTVGFMYNNATSKWRCVASA